MQEILVTQQQLQSNNYSRNQSLNAIQSIPNFDDEQIQMEMLPNKQKGMVNIMNVQKPSREIWDAQDFDQQDLDDIQLLENEL